MTSRILLFTALAACGGGESDPAHELVDCAGVWSANVAAKCERACLAGPLCNLGDFDCNVSTPLCMSAGLTCNGEKISTYEGQRFCCYDDPGDDKRDVTLALECEGE